jgi:hypothetical protein
MELFKYTRGHFFGIFIPGLFFIINVSIIFPELINYFGLNEPYILLRGEFGIYIIIFIFSYVSGVGLRLLIPSWLENAGLLFHIPLFTISIFYKSLMSKKQDRKFKANFKKRFSYYNQQFPYIKWFYDEFISTEGTTYKLFFNDILNTKFEANKAAMSKHFINQCKNYIYENSKGIKEEIIYNEGLTRFISGVLYSFLFTLIIVCFRFESFQELFYIYLFLFIFFLLHFRRIRIKEVLSVFDGYMFLNTK